CKNPLIHSGKIQGVLCLGASEPHDWSVFEKSTLREVAELVALTIHNTQVEKDRREAEVALATNRQRLSMALEATGSGTWDWNLQTGHVVSEDAWFRTLGYEQHQTVPHVRFWKTLVHPDDMRHVRNALKRHFSGETETYECINRLRKSNGKWRWSLDRGRVIEWSAEGKALRMVGTNTDITELRVLQEKLQESEARFQSILDHSPSLIYMKDRDGRYLLVNKKCEEMFGVTNEEIQGKMSHEVFPQKLADQFFRNDRLIMESRSPHLCEEHISQADGEHTVLSMQFPILDSTGKLNALCGISTDITARRLIEEALRKSEDRFEKYFESGLVGMAITSLNKGWIEVNERMCEILGFSRQELNEWTWAELTHPDDLAADEAKFTKLLAGGIESYSVEKRFVRKNGGAVHTNLYVNAVRNDVGTVEYVMAMIEDITGRKQAEQNLLEAQKALQNQNEALEQEVQRRSARIQELEQRRMQVEKLAALAQVAAGVAHEINNPLASISQAMLLVKQAVDPAHPYFEYVGRIDECIARMARIVQHMYELYRPQQSTLLEQNVVPIVSTAIDIMQPAAEKRLISLDAWLPDRIMTVLCVPTELVQIVCNLIQNALEASAPEQHVIVNITNDQKHVIVSISDKGSGISSDMFSHIFEPFFTTKGTEGGQGLGLGLSVSKSLVESMGGMLRFTSNKNQGSTFNIVLPVLTRKGKESI
ncbi:MAG: PAS domain S-box protein, partial [Nitrospirales bacterium]